MELIKKYMDVDVDAMRHINTYAIKAMYNKLDDKGFADIVTETVDVISLNWKDIDEMGGPHAAAERIRNLHGIKA